MMSCLDLKLAFPVSRKILYYILENCPQSKINNKIIIKAYKYDTFIIIIKILCLKMFFQ